MAEINFNTADLVQNFTDSDTLHITQSGSHKRLTIEKLIAKAKAEALSEMEAALLDKLTDGVYFSVSKEEIEENDKHKINTRFVTASQWATVLNSGYQLNGVMVLAPGHPIVIAPNELTIKFSSASNTALTQPTPESQLVSTFNGKELTETIVANAAYTNGADGAPGYCHAYSTLGRQAGSWWLPSVGEILIMLANKKKIDILMKICGGKEIGTQDRYYLSSCESSSGKHIYVVNSKWLDIDLSYKSSTYHLARPVTYYF